MPLKASADRKQSLQAARAARQRRYWLRVGLTFLLFSLFAAPLEIHVDWYAKWASNQPDWVLQVLGRGPLYFFAFTLCMEAILRLENHPHLVSTDNRVWFLRLALLAPGVVFFFQYFVARHYANGPPPVLERYVQVLTAAIAMFLAWIVHHIVTQQEARKIR